jgi:hypothetical protein
MDQDRYHVLLGKKSTTVTVDTIISDLLALKLGHDPKTEDARAAVRDYLQESSTTRTTPARRA